MGGDSNGSTGYVMGDEMVSSGRGGGGEGEEVVCGD